VFIDQTRRARVRAPMHGRAARSMEEELPADPGARPDEALAARESANAVGAALARLPMKQREAFILMRFEGLGFREAAQVAGATESAIRVRAFRAYEALRAALATQV
jgi:RNA polymerase sigma-70 factor, ECF subfamily